MCCFTSTGTSIRTTVALAQGTSTSTTTSTSTSTSASTSTRTSTSTSASNGLRLIGSLGEKQKVQGSCLSPVCFSFVVSVSVCPSVRLTVWLSVCLAVCLFILTLRTICFRFLLVFRRPEVGFGRKIDRINPWGVPHLPDPKPPPNNEQNY